MDIRQLQQEIQRLQTEADSKRRHAERRMTDANGYMQNGDNNRDKVEQDTAAQLTNEANDHISTANELMAELAEKQQRVLELENQKSAKEAELKAELERLEQEKRNLEGRPLSFF